MAKRCWNDGGADRTTLTFFRAHETVGHERKTVGTSARYFRRLGVDLRCRQTQVGTVAVNRGAVVDTVRLPVRMVHVYHHRVLGLRKKITITRRKEKKIA